MSGDGKVVGRYLARLRVPTCSWERALLVASAVVVAMFVLPTLIDIGHPAGYVQAVRHPFGSSSTAEQLQQVRVAVPTSTTSSRWLPGTTLRASDGRVPTNFNQTLTTTLVARSGDSVQLDCQLSPQQPARPTVSWYRGDSLIAMGRRVYVNDSRVYVYVNESTDNWALRIDSLTMADADEYTCWLPLPADPLIYVTLDVMPVFEQLEPPTSVWLQSLPTMKTRYTRGFSRVPHNGSCSDSGETVSVLVFVISHPMYAKDRNTIRKSWKKGSQNYSVEVVFGVGHLSEELNAEMLREADEYGDMVIGKFADVSADTFIRTIKILNALEFFSNYCPKADYLLLVSHSHFVNTQWLAFSVKSLPDVGAAVYGRLSARTDVVRDPTKPYYMPYMHYRGSTLPPHLLSPVFLVSNQAVEPLYTQTLQHRQLNLADLLVFGFAARQASVQCSDMPTLYGKFSTSTVKCGKPAAIVLQSGGLKLDSNACDVFHISHCALPT